MNGFTAANKASLRTLLEGGKQVKEVAYNPTTEVGTPEADAVAAGWVEYYRETTATLVEVIYTK
jgi:hypothetical protein